MMSVAPVSCFHYTQDMTLSKGNDEPRPADDETKLPICRHEYAHLREALAERKTTELALMRVGVKWN